MYMFLKLVKCSGRTVKLPIVTINCSLPLQCYLPHNSHALHGTSDEYPLCAAEMVADMFAVTNTETCFRRSEVYIL